MVVPTGAPVGRSTDVRGARAVEDRFMNRHGSLLCPLLVGRDELLRLADRRIAEAAAGRGGLLMLAGEAGIGKSRVLGAMLRKATTAGFRIAKSDLGPHDRQVPLASVLDLARTMRALPAFGSAGDDLLALHGGQGGDTLGSRRILVHQIADRIMATIAGPTVLAFEDLQWADEMSLEVIGELARRSAGEPLLLFATYRLEELPAGSLHREWRSRLVSQRLAEEARLGRLSPAETALATTLILGTGLPAPREVVLAVQQRTNGIPLHIEELLAALDEDARNDGDAIRRAVVPDTIEDAVLARAGRLSAEAQAVARAGAVMGRCFIPEVLAGILDRPVGDLEAPLEELVANGILYPFDFLDRGFYDFRHQLLRDALYATVPAAELRRFHARAGEFGALIEGASEIHASVHFERAGLRSQAYRAALAAARAASALSSRQEAFELYGRAAANVPDTLTPLELATLYDEYADAAFAVDNVTVSEQVTRLARRFFLEAGRPIEAARQLVQLAGLARRDVRSQEERRQPLIDAEAELEPLPASPARADVLSSIRELQAFQAVDTMDLGRAAAKVRDAARLAAEAGLQFEDDLEFYLAQIDTLAGQTDEGLERMLRVARVARVANLETFGVTAFRVAASLAVRVMNADAARRGLDEGLRYADAVEQSYCRRIMAATSAHLAWASGRWDEAVAIAEIELVERGTRRGTLGSRDALAFVALGRGQVERARSLLQESLAVARGGGDIELLLPPLWGLAEAALVAGEPNVAVEHCTEAVAIAESGGERALLIPFVVTGVRACLADRRPDQAEQWLARTTALLDGWEHVAGPAIQHGAGLLRIADGSTSLARAALTGAVEGWDQRGRLWEATWARLDLAGCLMRMNRHAEVGPLLDEAARVAAEVRSQPLAERAQALAGRARGRGFESEPWRPLTAREFAVTRLIAEGMTNAEIADALSIAPKTVSAHVEHILAKLGVNRRAEAAAWVATVAGPSAEHQDGRLAATGAAGGPRRG
jgi:DNA-binding CsgD family transcriptional regulator